MAILRNGVKDTATQRALAQLDRQTSKITQRFPVTGTTDTEKLNSLIAALTKLGIISDQTE